MSPLHLSPRDPARVTDLVSMRSTGHHRWDTARMRKILSAALLGATLAVGTLASPAPASADTPRCATFKEFRQIDRGMKKAQVHRILDIRGQFADGAAGGYTRFYGSCQSVSAGGGDSGAYITYNGDNDRVVEKRWYR